VRVLRFTVEGHIDALVRLYRATADATAVAGPASLTPG